MPVDNPLCNKNKKEVTALVFKSKRFSRYSYAVYTFSLLNAGMKEMQMTMAASGSPK